MKRSLIPALALALSLSGTQATAEGDGARAPQKPLTAQMAAEDLTAEVTLSTKAHKGGYGNPDVVFFFVLAYLAAAVAFN